MSKDKVYDILKISRGGWRVYNEDTDRVYYIEPNRPATYVLYGGNREITVRVYHTGEEANNASKN